MTAEEALEQRDRLPWTRLVLAAFCLLLAWDVGLRLSARTHSLKGSLHRWIPLGDILKSSSLSDLKYLRDVGDYELQGLAIDTDTKLLYTVHTMAVRVFMFQSYPSTERTMAIVSEQTRRVWNPRQEFPLLLRNSTVAHLGGVDLSFSEKHGLELWMAAHSEGLNGPGGLVAVDALNLNPKRDRTVMSETNLDWVAERNGVLYFGEFFNVTRIHRVHLETLEPLSDVTLQLPDDLSGGGINYVQSGAFDKQGRLVLLGDDYQCTVYFINVESGEMVYSQGLLLGSQTDGLTFYGDTMLVGLNRQHSHEQVMGEEPMVSVIQLEPK